MGTIRSRSIRSVLLFLTLIFGFLSPIVTPLSYGQNHFSGRVVAIESGDRIRVRLDTFEMTVRLHGIACPTMPPSLRDRAREYTRRRVGDTVVRVDVRGTGAKQTVYGDVHPQKGEILNAELIRVGLAVWERQYAPHRQDLALLDQEAKQAARGMYSDPTGANVPLPPMQSMVAHNALRHSPRPVLPDRRTPRATAPTARAATASPVSTPPSPVDQTVSPVRASKMQPTARTSPRPPRKRTVADAIRAIMATSFIVSFSGVMIALLIRTGIRRRSLPAQAATATILGMGTAFIFPLPLLTAAGSLRATPPIIVAAVLVALTIACLFLAATIGRQENFLRSTPQRNIADLESEELVRVRGRAFAPAVAVYSETGDIPGIYVREISFRYDPIPGRNGRPQPHQWVLVHEKTRAIDFLLADETGTVTVEGERATFHPLRVARFYNDIPVEQFFAESYSGDVRTEVFFIPPEANVTVWGRYHETASPLSEGAVHRIGFDPLSRILTVVEENPARLFTKRPMVGLALTLVAVLGTAGIVICFTSPETITGWVMGAVQR